MSTGRPVNDDSMFEKILIANRGAIAVRMARTLRKMGIACVAVYADSDAESLHLRCADEAICLGEGGATDTYLNQEKILEIARATGAQAILPGYGFLSENADFARRCEASGLAFIGPTAEQIDAFGLKHTAREIAQSANVPLLTGSGLLASVEEARRKARDVGYPVMLKSTAGGGGIGMQLCHDEAELSDAFESVKRLGSNNFSNDGIFLEKFIARARHIEVQVFGNGAGEVVAIGERDCSAQRRNQKVIEECPAPHLGDALRQQLFTTAESLCAKIDYRSVGTVEYIVDADTQEFYFLEVNTRLQVEHGVTEEVYGLDLVEWMIRLAAGDESLCSPAGLREARRRLTPKGHAIQVRLYAEDPYLNFQPSSDLLSQVQFAQLEDCRIDHWIESGLTISPFFDPMLAKIIAHADSREAALARLRQALQSTRLYGCATNLDYLLTLSRDPAVVQGRVTTRYLNDVAFQPCRIDVMSAGMLTTIQDLPGRAGYWHVGVPPSGPFDRYSFALGNALLDNAPDAAGLEITLQGPTLTFSSHSQIVITGAAIEADLDGNAIPGWAVVDVRAGQTLRIGGVAEQGARSYLLLRGGIQCPSYLESRSTFTLGQFGGHNGRALRAGDVLDLDASVQPCPPASAIPEALRPTIDNLWQLRVIYGPHGAPDFFTHEDIAQFFDSQWEVHYNSSRTGIRLIGPKPEWARVDGGEAGLHPSNIHDNAYAFGTVDFTGDMPVILGPDGPSLGGFVCPATVIQADLWKLGQLRAGDKIEFVPVDHNTAVKLSAGQNAQIESLQLQPVHWQPRDITSPVLARLNASDVGDDVVYRCAGDQFLLVEYGEQVLDIALRFRVHALMQYLHNRKFAGVLELTPGIRSLQVHYDPHQLPLQQLLDHLIDAEHALHAQLDELAVPSRIVHIPLSWDDDACKEAIVKYDQSVRANAPWAPSNLEFIRRINGIASIDAVKSIVFNASYLVMGLGDVYLGAPVATPMDPRHRLVTTKYNPARTWTAENSVGIGGAYLCVYGMEGPGGYQFIGRTLQMWNRYRTTPEFSQPWLLRFFDQIRFYEVSQEELLTIRRQFPLGQYPLKIDQTTFSLTDYEEHLARNHSSIEAFTRQRQLAFQEELARWHADGQFNFATSKEDETQQAITLLACEHAVESTVSGSVWQLLVEAGEQVTQGQTLLVMESMKMEIAITANHAGTVSKLLVNQGSQVRAGQTLALITDTS